MEIIQIPALTDNYMYFLRDDETKKTAIVDPAEAEPVLKELKNRGWKLDFILNTHHHWDHTGGNIDLKTATNCKIYGSKKDKDRIPGIDQTLEEGDVFRLGKTDASIIFTPGHTRGQILFYFEKDRALFSGDTLFAMGCGRLFEGTPEVMWESLSKLRSLPRQTRVFCGHEYTVNNAEFSMTVEPGNSALQSRLGKARKLRQKNTSTVPFTMGEELDTSPFLRPQSPEIRKKFNLEGAKDVEVFTAVRQLRDQW